MKKILLILALLCVSLQAQTYQFESATTASGGITTVTAREKTGWTSNGTTAQDTLATVYRLDKANVRFIVTDADGDTLWFYPQNLLPFVLKDGSTILAAIDSSGRAGFGTSTSGQARRAILNVLGRAANDTLLVLSNDGGGVVGDSSITVGSDGNLGVGEVADAFTRIAARTTSNTSSTTALLLKKLDGSTLLQVRSDGNTFFGNLLLVGGSGIEDNSYGGYIRIGGTSGAINMASANSNVIRLTPASQVVVGATTTKANQAFLTVNANGTADTLMMARNDKNSTLDSTAMVFADGSVQFGTASGGSDAFTTTAETDTVTVVGAGVNDIYTVTLKGTAAPAAADLCAVEALAGKFVVHRSAAGTSALAYYWRRERR